MLRIFSDDDVKSAISIIETADRYIHGLNDQIDELENQLYEAKMNRNEISSKRKDLIAAFDIKVVHTEDGVQYKYEI